jgi:capsular polysaccharide transport system ATP-binding protein
MITFANVYKSYLTKAGVNPVLNDINLKVRPGERLGILGKNGAGKSTLVKLLSGSTRPTKGKIERSMSVSWPLGLTGGLQSNLTGYDNVRFIARIYGVSPEYSVGFIQEFTELGHYLDEPVKTYSSGMRAKLGFAISFLVDFDCYLIDEALAVGDAAFREKCHYELFEKRKHVALIMVSHNNKMIEQYCDSAVLLKDKQIHHFDSLDQAIQSYS